MLDLRRAAAIIFALVGVLPLLLFVFFLWHFDLAARTEAQMGLFLALVVAVLGYAVFHRMVARISSLARAVDVAAPVDATGSRAPVDHGAVAARVCPARPCSSASPCWWRTSRPIRGSASRTIPSTAVARSSACPCASPTGSSASSTSP